MSLGSETVIAAAAAQATSTAVQPQAKRQPEAARQKMRASLPFEQRIDLPGQAFSLLCLIRAQRSPFNFLTDEALLCFLRGPRQVFNLGHRSTLGQEELLKMSCSHSI